MRVVEVRALRPEHAARLERERQAREEALKRAEEGGFLRGLVRLPRAIAQAFRSPER